MKSKQSKWAENRQPVTQKWHSVIDCFSPIKWNTIVYNISIAKSLHLHVKDQIMYMTLLSFHNWSDACKGPSIYKLHKWLQDLISLYIVFGQLDLFKALKEQKEIYQCQSPKT